MDYKIIFSLKAVNDLETIVRYVALDNPEIVKRLRENLLNKAKELEKFPLRGQIVPEFDQVNLHQLLFKPYRIIYRVKESKKQISIARFWQTAREQLKL